MIHRFPVTVYYEDTDMGGIVYYANYLKFIERARSTWVAELGVDQLAMKDDGVVFAVRRVEADYLAPAKLGNSLEVRTDVQAATPARWILQQDIWRDETHLFSAVVTIVAIGDAGQPVRLPAELRRRVN
ncbi:MAG: tol-pal system-associated acyl-CoA thioesterase [Pseudomonadota bacterium]